VAGHVTVSLGVAAGLPYPGAAATGVLQAADQALYEAKLGGRNCVCVQQRAAQPSPSARPPTPLPTTQPSGAL
ncbi:MAG: diguanylate cyclase, partial [Rhodocyclaceae bacterium]|nr:diguanylate cyclase [Rhodocyclaceae bacterium]